MSPGGANGKALARAYISNHNMAGPEAAKELVNDVDDGNMSDSEIAKRVKEAEKKGNKLTNQGASAYRGSQQYDLNRNTSQKEANQSKTASTLNFLTKASNIFTTTATGGLMLSAAGGIARQIPGQIGGSLMSGLTKSGGFSRLFGLGGDAAETASSGAGIFSKVGSGLKSMVGLGGEAGVAADAANGVKGASTALRGLAPGASEGLTGAAGAARWLGPVGIAVAGIGGAIETYNDYKKHNTQAGKNKAVAHGVGKTGGGILGGMAAGVATGAAAGTVFGPLGTLVAGVGGGIIGGIAGSSLGGWIGNKAGDAWNWVTDTKDKKKKTSGSQAKVATSQSLINQKNQQQMLDQWQKIMDQWTKNIKDTNSANGSSGKATAKSSSSKSGHAFGGLVTQRTEIAEGDKPEYVVPLDPAKQNSTKSALSQITQMTGIRSTDERPQMVTQAGPFQPNITINHTGNGGSNDDDVLITKLNQALKNATDDYRFNFQKG